MEDEYGQLVWQTPKLLSTNIYTYDNLVNRKSNQVTVLNPDGQQYSTHTENYDYDELNRLESVSYSDNGQSQTYTFDNMGNRTEKVDTLTGNESYGYNEVNMLISRNGQSYVNDPNGNTLTGGGRTNTWDSQNRLVQCITGGKTSTFTYGADGLRRKMVVNDGTTTKTTDYLLDGQSVIREITNDGTNTSVATYLVGPRGPEYRRVDTDNDGETDSIMWYVYDGLGTVLAEVDEIGNIKCNNKLDVYGLARPNSPPDTSTSDHKFVGGLGHTTDDSTGLIYMRARHYDPALGRFISEDPARQGDNWFTYCMSNPVNVIDADGRIFGFISLLLTAGIWNYEEGEDAGSSLIVYKESKALVKALQKLNLGISRRDIGNAIHEAKKYAGLGGADAIALDRYGGVWTATGEFIGFFVEFL